MSELEQASKSLVGKYASLLEYFGEDPGLKCQDFFAVLSRFACEFAATRDNIERQRKLEEKRERARVDAEKLATQKAAKAAAAVRAKEDNRSLAEMQLTTPPTAKEAEA